MVAFVKFNGDKRNKYFSKQPFKYFNRRNISKINLLPLFLETHLTKFPKRANPLARVQKEKGFKKCSKEKRGVARLPLLLLLPTAI